MAEKKMTLTIKELNDLLEGKGSEEIKQKIAMSQIEETNKAARQAAKDAISTACQTFIDGNLASLDIPAGIMGISMTFPYIPGDNSFMVSETGFKVDFGDQSRPSSELLHLVSLAEVAKEKKDNRPQSFLKTGLGDNVYTRLVSINVFNAGLGATLTALYSSETAASFNVDGIPEGDQAKVVIRYTKDADIPWFATITVGKSVSSGNGGKRRPRTAKPGNYKNWQAKVNECPEQHLVEARKWLAEKYPGDWGKSISAPKVLIKYKDAEFIQKRAEADSRADL